MYDFKIFGIIFILHFLAVSSPGPDFILVLKNTLNCGKKAGSYTSLGIALGVSVHIFYSLTGIALLLKTNQNLFQIVKIVGAIYILYLGLKILIQDTKKTKIVEENLVYQKNCRATEMIKTGFLTNLLNPKASLFFLSIFSIVIPPQTPNYILALIILMIFTVNYFWFDLVAHIFSRKKIMEYYLKFENILQKVFGFLLIIIALEIIIF